MNESEIIATATIEKRYTGLGTSPSVVKLIPRRAGSISSLYGAKTNLQAKNLCLQPKKKSPAYKTAALPTLSSFSLMLAESSNSDVLLKRNCPSSHPEASNFQLTCPLLRRGVQELIFIFLYDGAIFPNSRYTCVAPPTTKTFFCRFFEQAHDWKHLYLCIFLVRHSVFPR